MRKLIYLLFFILLYTSSAQAWQIETNLTNLENSRYFSTNYTNTNNYPVFLIFNSQSDSCSEFGAFETYTLYINGVIVDSVTIYLYNSDPATDMTVSAFVPVFANYSIYRSGACIGNLYSWYEWNTTGDGAMVNASDLMNLNYTMFNGSSNTEVVVVYNQGLIILLLAVIAFCLVANLGWRLIIDIYVKPIWRKNE